MVGVAQVAEFVHADVVGHVFGRADEPPVEADIAAAAYAPEGFGAAEGCVLGNKLQALGVCGEAGEEVGFGQRLEVLAQEGLLALESTLQAVICHQNLTAQYHLIRFFYAQSDNETMTVEFMIDNQDGTAEEENQFAQLPWPRRETYYSVRRCIMLKPLDEGRA